jgi:tetratricopeptide (TPR) repeat protein
MRRWNAPARRAVRLPDAEKCQKRRPAMRRLPNTLPLLAALLAVLLAGPAASQSAVARSQQRVATAQQQGTQAQRGEPSVLKSDFVRKAGRRGLGFLYNMKFRKAERAFSKISKRYPDHPVGPFLQGLTTWWRVLLDLTDTRHDERFHEQMETVVERANDLLDESPESRDATFFKAAALGFQGRLHSNRSEWWGAANAARRALGPVLTLVERNPQNADFAFGKGIYDYYTSLFAEEYPVAKPFMGLFPEGSKERGLKALRRTAEDGWFIQTEANYFLLQIQYRYEESFAKSRERVEWLRREHPNNPFFHNFEGRVYAKWGRWKEARDIFDTVLARYYGGRTGYNDHMAEIALYYMGRSHLVYDEYRKALGYFVDLERLTKSEEGGEESFFRTLGRLRQGMVYDALGERAAAKQRYRSVLKMQDHADAHARAERFLKEAYDG